jgi:hypothetical protein
MPGWSGKANDGVREGKAMADLIAIGYPDEAAAEGSRADL